MKKKLIIFGNTIVAKLAHYYFTRDSEYQLEAFTVDADYLTDDNFKGFPLVRFEDVENVYDPKTHSIFIAVGPNKMNSIREKKYLEAKAKGYSFASYVSPHAVCGSNIGENTIVADMVIINPFVDIGNNNFFWEQCLVSNEAIIKDNCYFSPKSVIGSYCVIESNSIVGTSSTIKARVNVASKTLVGSNCYISKNTEVNGVYGEKSSVLLGCISEKIDISL